MANVNHSTLTDPYLHEPKGASTAVNGQVYVSNGAASGSWKYLPSGWGYYQHSGAAQTFNTTDAKLVINGTGALNNTSYLPREIRGVGNLWDTVNNKITPIRLGDSYDTRIDLPITSRTTAVELTISLDIGGGATPTTIILPQYTSIAKTAPFTVSIPIPMLALSATTVTNGIQLFIKVDAGSIAVTNPSISIIRTHGGEI